MTTLSIAPAHSRSGPSTTPTTTLSAVPAQLRTGPSVTLMTTLPTVPAHSRTGPSTTPMTTLSIAPAHPAAAGGPPTAPPLAAVSIRPADGRDADAIGRLVAANVGPGLLLPRSPADIQRHAPRFLVAARGGAVIGCGELAPLSKTMSEVRSLVVAADERGAGVGARLLASLVAAGRRRGTSRVCAFTHMPRAFVAQGFSIVPHTWLPEKIMTDCQGCEWFRRCAQYAVVLELGGARGRGPRRRRR